MEKGEAYPKCERWWNLVESGLVPFWRLGARGFAARTRQQPHQVETLESLVRGLGQAGGTGTCLIPGTLVTLSAVAQALDLEDGRWEWRLRVDRIRRMGDEVQKEIVASAQTAWEAWW